ncbi:uncharacterized protein LOC143297337 [Babylonia areolata]|uniref:uncharacterized protein LOC143297337 n=1 Tax=Babylonia areolata TaxID=304850 RepID=UPI003FD5E7E3
MATQGADGMAGDSGQARAALLLIVGEPFSDSAKQQIVDEIVKGLKRWNSEASGVDIDPELSQMALRADLGEERPHGERVVHYQSDKMVVELLVNPQALTVKESLRTLLTLPSPAKAVVFAGYCFHGNPAWVLQDDLFSFTTFCQVFKDPNVENAIKQTEGATLMLSTVGGSDWSAALKGSEVNKLLKVTVNPGSKTEDGGGVAQFSAYIVNLVRVVPLASMLQASDVIGNISFSRPVLYIFPSYQGDAALFGMKGFNMLVDAGYSRRPCFWDFVRHLDGIDALLMTHLGADNLFGLKALLDRKVSDSVHPDIDYMYMNVPKGNGAKAIDQGETSASELVISLATEGSKLVDLSRKLGHAPHPLTRPLSSNLEPVNLFHKVGKGSLDMYVLNPVGDAKEMKEFLAQWGKQASSFGQANGVPIPNCSSICALLVVRPASSMEKVTRILFPGTAPQHKLLEGLERVKHLEFLKHPTFCTHDLLKSKKAAMTNGRASSVSRRTVSATASRSTTRAEPPRHLDTKPSPRASLPSPASGRTSKLQKDSSNKRVSGVTRDKVKRDEKEKEDKSKSSTSSSPSKASIKTISPTKSPSPARTPATASPEEQPPAVDKKPAAPKPASDDKPSAPSQDLDQHVTASSAVTMAAAPSKVETLLDDNRLAASPDALPAPDHFGSDVDSSAQPPAAMIITERAKLQELGIYDNDDDDEGVDNRYDEKENGGMFGARDFSEEEVQPQALPEPVAVLETPTSSESDMIPDTFAKPSLMEQSQLFEHGIEPDYGNEGEVCVTEPHMEQGVEKQTTDPGDEGSSLLTGPPIEPSPPADPCQAVDSSVSDFQPEDLQSGQAGEPSSEAEPLAAESALMTQQMPEESYPTAEHAEEKTTFDDMPQDDPVCLVPETMTKEASPPAESAMEDFAPQASFPAGSVLLREQEVEDEQLPASAEEDVPPSFAPQEDDQVPMYQEESKAVAPSSDYQEDDEPDQSDDEVVKETPADTDLKEEVGADISEDEGEESVPPASYGQREPSPVIEEQQLSATEPALEHPAQDFDQDHEEEEDQTFPPCHGSQQASSPEQSGLSNSLHDFEGEVQDNSTSLKDPCLAPQEPDLEDNARESHSGLEEPSFEDSLKEASPLMDGPSFHDSLREPSPFLQQPGDDDHAAGEPGLEGSLREPYPAMEEPGCEMKEPSPPFEEHGFDMREKDTSPAVDEPSFDIEEREANPTLEEPNFDMKESSPPLEEPEFEVKESSPPLEEPDSEMKEASLPLEKPGSGMKEASPPLEEPGSEMKESSPPLEVPGSEMKEASPPLEERGSEMKETSPPLKELASEMKEASPPLEERGSEMKETSPPLEELGSEMKETSPPLEELGSEMKEASPPLEELGSEMKEASPPLEERGSEMKEASPPLEEPGSEMKEASPSLQEPEFEMKESLEEAGFEMKEEPDFIYKEREASPFTDEFDTKDKIASPMPEEQEFDVKEQEACPVLKEPGFAMEVGPVLKEPDFEMKEMEASSALEQPGYEEPERGESPVMEKVSSDDTAGAGFVSMKEREASPCLEEPDLGEEKEASLTLAEQGFDTYGREVSPALEDEKNDGELRELSPPPSHLGTGDHAQEHGEFADKAEVPDLCASHMERPLPSGHAQGQGLEINGADEAEEDLLDEEEVLKREEVTGLKEELAAKEEEEDEEVDVDDRAQADMMTHQTMDNMDMSDDDDQDEDEETAEAVDSGDDNDDFVYEKEVNVEDEEVLMAGASVTASKEQTLDTEEPAPQKMAGMDVEEKEDQTLDSQIPAHTLPAKDNFEEKKAWEEEKKLGESYGQEGGLREENGDMAAMVSMQQTHPQADLAQDEDSDLDSQDPDPTDHHSLNPFIGIGETSPASGDTAPTGHGQYAYEDDDVGQRMAPEDDEGGQRMAPVGFDPMAQWGPPTGLPAPAPQLDDVDAVPEPLTDTESADSLKSGEFVSCPAASEEPYDDDMEAVSRPEHPAEGDFTGSHIHGDQFEKDDDKDICATDKSSEVDAAEFDPLAEWGKPMGLPAPTPPDTSNKKDPSRKGAGDAKKADSKKPGATPTKKTGPASATKSPPKATNGTADTPRSARSKPEARKAETPRSTRPASARNQDSARHDPKTRTTPTPTRRTASSARSRVSPEVIKMPPLPPFSPFYVDLTYIPSHGDTGYVDSEFFKRVRARYYVLSARNPNPKVLEMLMDAKASWDKANEQEVTIIPTYETQILQHWMAVHKEKLAENKIDIAPAASRCTVRLQDHEDSCYTYRLEF